jgi:hypothetical protein
MTEKSIALALLLQYVHNQRQPNSSKFNLSLCDSCGPGPGCLAIAAENTWYATKHDLFQVEQRPERSRAEQLVRL